MIDCGEGTQTAVRQQGWSFKPIDVLCITHFHADHISGLPGLLLTMGNAERTEPLTIIGPKRIEKVVEALRTIAPELPFPIQFTELEEREQTFDILGLKLHAFRVNHNVVCYGYSIELPRQGRFDAAAAKAKNIPLPYWRVLQSGEDVTVDGVTYTSDMVMGPARKGLKVTYCTDTRPIDLIAEAAKGSDLFICEGMYGEPEKEAKAKENKHMTMYEAAKLAKTAEVGELWLTHFSPSLVRPMDYIDKVRKIFPAAYIGKDRMTKELNFEEE
jgi:ribonuclease Z